MLLKARRYFCCRYSYDLVTLHGDWQRRAVSESWELCPAFAAVPVEALLGFVL